MLRIGSIEYKFVKPYYLFDYKQLKLIKPKIRSSTLTWNISGKIITYNQLKKLLYEHTKSNNDSIRN